jgi:hypothetical protein
MKWFKIEDRIFMGDFDINLSANYNFGEILHTIEIKALLSNQSDLNYLYSLKGEKFELKSNDFSCSGCFIKKIDFNSNFNSNFYVNIEIMPDYIVSLDTASKRNETIDYILNSK